MERQLFEKVYQLLFALPISVPRRGAFSDQVIVLVYLWSVLHDRTMNWACNKRNWPIDLRQRLVGRRGLPSNTTVGRRMRRQAGLMLQRVREELAESIPVGKIMWIDSRPLRIPGRSQDKDAGRGRTNDGFSSGYRLHALVDAKCKIARRFEVLPMNRNDVIGARRLLPHLPANLTLVADAQYDTNELHLLTQSRGSMLLAGLRQGRLPQDGARRSPECRRQAMRLTQTNRGRRLLKERSGIESVFSRHANTPALLGPLPNWVRSLPRVTLWVTAKLLFDTIRQCRKSAPRKRLAA